MQELFTTAEGGAGSFEIFQTCTSRVKNKKGLLDCNQRRGCCVLKVRPCLVLLCTVP